MQSRLLFFIESQKLQLLVLSLASGFRLLLALHAGLLIVFSLAKLGEDAGTGGCTLKATKSAIQRFAFLNSDFCHFLIPPLNRLYKICSRGSCLREISLKIIHDFCPIVKSFFNFFDFYFFSSKITGGRRSCSSAAIALGRHLE